MGACIHFGTSDNGTSSSGFSGFPFWTPSIADDPYYLSHAHFSLNREDAIKFFWRVKGIYLVADREVHGPASFSDILHVEVPCDFYLGPYAPYTDERVLMAQNTSYLGAWAPDTARITGTLSGFGGGTAWSASIPGDLRGALYITLSRVPIAQDGQKFYYTVYAEFGMGRPILQGLPANCSFILSGFPSFAIVNNPSSWTPGPGYTTSSSLVATPTKFWPYSCPPIVLCSNPYGFAVGQVHPNAGQPIYDETTGQTLLDPVTGFAPE